MDTQRANGGNPMLKRRVLKNNTERPSLTTKISEAFRWNNNHLGLIKLPDLIESLGEAHREWRFAKLFFNNVNDPDLIDFAIYNLDATEKKYIYLLKRARETGASIEGFALD